MAIREGDAGNNSLRGTNKSDVLSGLGGNDTLDAVSIQPGTAFDIVDGGEGNDVLNIDATSETESVTLLSGSNPSFALRSLSGRFMLDAFSIERINIATGSADDFIWTGGRPGSVSGRLGIDHWTADLSALTGDVVFDLRKPTNDIVDGGFTLRVETIERITLTTGSGNDRIIGARQGDTIDGGEGNDTIDAGSRPAVLGSPVDIVVGGDGFDRLFVDAQSETQAVRLLFGAGLHYTVRSDSGNFAVDAFEFEDVFFKGGKGDDFIQTGTRGGIVNGGGGVNFWSADVSALTSRVTIDLNEGHVSIPAAGLAQVSAIDGVSLSGQRQRQHRHPHRQGPRSDPYSRCRRQRCWQ